jgi:hypothetical protein
MLRVCHTCRDLGINYLQLFGTLTYNRNGLLGLAFADTALESMEKSGLFFEVLTVKDLQTVKYTRNKNHTHNSQSSFPEGVQCSG